MTFTASTPSLVSKKILRTFSTRDHSWLPCQSVKDPFFRAAKGVFAKAAATAILESSDHVDRVKYLVTFAGKCPDGFMRLLGKSINHDMDARRNGRDRPTEPLDGSDPQPQ
jgi:hypothetical protein